ncbi:TPA: hypothetical protein N0F65_006622 [Lagenidium giganteum]|uniref:CRC domain-containing protein n=1 Tax=Lagenidium giganteum TaxID=4803 RepID=A0AAV2ZBT8_9STRA|nr:TPA: hypothetical protein N0F65_006622 [Lagenidium giganteum]
MGKQTEYADMNAHRQQRPAATGPPMARLVNSFKPIPDRYETLAEVQADLRKAGLESSNLVIGIDFTKSNQWTGERSFQGRCLHDIDPNGLVLNPYQSVISVIGRVLEPFDDDNIIPAFGFGDLQTKGDRCFPFVEGRGCHGFSEVMQVYNRITPSLKLSGPTNFAPVIHETIEAVRREGGYHILVIIADGQVTNEDQTRNAIVEASYFPISIIMVGVGDGPWDMMKEFDDMLPARRFDNFQFVEYNSVMQLNRKNPEAGFAIMALMEIPEAADAVRKEAAEHTSVSSTPVVASERKRGRAKSTEQSHSSASASGAPTPTRRRGCNCKKSGCLKLYCECFAGNMRCGDRCQCVGCKNREHNRLEIAHAIQAIEKRTQKSFRSPIAVARKLEKLRTTPTATGPPATSLSGTTSMFSPEAVEAQSMATLQPREACTCAGGICTSDCACLSRFGRCTASCPCSGCPFQQEKPKRCSCKKSNCLKLYCECLTAQGYCDERCNCEGCKNRPESQAERERAISAILERNPLAFQPKVANGSSQHLRGCNCRKSNCMKNYCECHQAGVACTSRCACHQCRNTEAFVSAKKMLVFSTPDSKQQAHSLEHQHQRGKGTKRALRKASIETSPQVSQPFTPQTAYQLSPLELLSRSAPPAAHHAPAQGAMQTSGGMGFHTVSAKASGHFTKRKQLKLTARAPFLERIEEAATAMPVTATLPPVEASLDADFNDPEASLSRMCRSLLHAAMAVDTSVGSANSSQREVTPGVHSPSTAEVAAAGCLSPDTEKLMCGEDMETPVSHDDSSDPASSGQRSHRSQQRHAALQERVVLQEFSVWLRNMT